MKSRLIRSELIRIRVRKKIFGTGERPRLSVHRSLKHIYAQIIDDLQGKTLASASTREKGFSRKSGTESAALVGKSLAKKAVAKGISQVVFDRGTRAYHGRVKALADGARESGLKF